MGEVIALASQVMVQLAAEQLYAVHSRVVTELLRVMQAWLIVDSLKPEAAATFAQSSQSPSPNRLESQRSSPKRFQMRLASPVET